MWTVELIAVAADELEALPMDMQSSFERIATMIRDRGLHEVREPYVKHLQDKLWEMRLKGRDGIARSIYVTATGKRVVVVRVFIKKTEKTPRRELEIALQRAKEIL